jgi:hypothetical protein
VNDSNEAGEVEGRLKGGGDVEGGLREVEPSQNPHNVKDTSKFEN